RFMLSVQQGLVKSVLIAVILNRPATDFCITYRSAWYCSSRFTTSRACTMARPYLNIVRKFSEPLYRFIHLFSALFHCTHQTSSFFEKIWTAYVANKYKIAGKYHDRF